MSVNVGTIDRVLRALIGLGLLILAFGGVSDLFAAGAAKWIAAAVGLILLATAAVRMCPLYSLLGIRTCKL